MVRCTDHPAMTIAVDLGRKAKKKRSLFCLVRDNCVKTF